MRRFRLRRRAFRRLAGGLFGPPAGAGRGLGPGPMRELERAHQLMAAGEYDEAADIFGQLADGAEAHGMPQRAAHLHLQAARALIELGEPDNALGRARRGLALFAAAGRPGHAARLSGRIAEELRARGYNAQAEAVAALSQDYSGFEKSTDYAAVPRRGTLPAKCPHCGGAMRPDEVEWIDGTSAECDYCGSVVKAE